MPALDKENLKHTICFTAVVKGFVLSLVCSLFLSFVAGAVYHFSSVPEYTLPWLTVAILALSSFCGSLLAGREAGNRGLYHGLSVGLFFFIAVWLASGLLIPGQAVLSAIYKLLTVLTAGAAGGITGVSIS